MDISNVSEGAQPMEGVFFMSNAAESSRVTPEDMDIENQVPRQRSSPMRQVYGLAEDGRTPLSPLSVPQPTATVEVDARCLVQWASSNAMSQQDKAALKTLKEGTKSMLEPSENAYKALLAQGKSTLQKASGVSDVSEEQLPVDWSDMSDKTKRDFVRDEIRNVLVTQGLRFLRAELSQNGFAIYCPLPLTSVNKKISDALSRLGKKRGRVAMLEQFSVERQVAPFGTVPTNTTADDDTILGTEMQQKVIRAAYRHIGIHDPFPFQMNVVHHFLYGGATTVASIEKTGSGKTAVMNVLPYLLHKGNGIAVVVYPLVSLGIDQEQKAQDRGIRGAVYYHCLPREQKMALQNDLKALVAAGSYTKYVPTIIMCTEDDAQKLAPVFLQLDAKNLLSILIVDEAHDFSRDGKRFRSGLLALNDKIFKSLSPSTKILAMSATVMSQELKDIEIDIINREFDCVVWGGMSRRNIYVRVHVECAGTHTERVTDLTKDFLSKHQDSKCLVYNELSRKVEGTIRDHGIDTLDGFRAEGRSEFKNARLRTCVGQEGLMVKCHVMQDVGKRITDHRLSDEPYCQILAGTSAIKLGFSAPDLHCVVSDGPPSSPTTMLQVFGRLGREHNPGPDSVTNRFHVVLSVSSVIALVERCHQNAETSQVCKIDMEELLMILRILVLTTSCYHKAFESPFQCPAELKEKPFVFVHGNDPFGNCGTSCSVCSGERDVVFPKVKRVALMDILEKLARDEALRKMTFRDLPSHLNTDKVKKRVWSSAAQKSAAHANAIVLQLYAAGIIVEKVSSKPNGDQIVGWKLGIIKDTEAPSGERLAWKDTAQWAGISYE